MHPTSCRALSRREVLQRLASTAGILFLSGPGSRLHADPLPPQALPTGRRTILFLGDSITYSGQWVVWAETWFRLTTRSNATTFINLGLPSETVSGLSEPGHAGGSFPRPDLHERLARALDLVRPDLVVACYGMNDGIYHPYSDERANRHFDGIRRLRTAVLAAGAALIHLTPPSFDPLPLKGRTLPAGRDAYPSPFEGYDGVLERYAQWLLERRQDGWIVGDIHGSMAKHLAERRKANPEYTLAGDGVHPGPTGHWLMTRELIRLWNAAPALLSSDSPDALLGLHPKGREVADLVGRRQTLLRDSWLSRVGHKRPGIGAGKPLETITAELDSLHDKIHTIVG